MDIMPMQIASWGGEAMSQFVVTIRETTDHQVVVDAATPAKARREAERLYRSKGDVDVFKRSVGQRTVFCRPAIYVEDKEPPKEASAG
jgi:hypothetical protein